MFLTIMNTVHKFKANIIEVFYNWTDDSANKIVDDSGNKVLFKE